MAVYSMYTAKHKFCVDVGVEDTDIQVHEGEVADMGTRLHTHTHILYKRGCIYRYTGKRDRGGKTEQNGYIG